MGILGDLLGSVAEDLYTNIPAEVKKLYTDDLEQLVAPDIAFKPFTVSGPTGRIQATKAGGTKYTLDPTSANIQSALESAALSRFGTTPAGAGQLGAAGGQLLGLGQQQLGMDPFGLAGQEAAAQQAFGLGGQFMGQAGMPMAGREQDVYNRIRATQLGEEERQRLALEERLFNQGRGGVQTAMFGGTPEQLALAKAQESSQNQAALMALTQAQQEQRQAADIGATYGQLGSNIATQRQALETAQQMQALQALTGGMGLLTGGMGLQQAQQQLGLGALGGAYVPQAQLLSAIQATQLFPQLQQQAQLFGTGQYGETMMTGIEAQLIAEQARANLLGGIGSGLLGGLFSPVATKSGGVGTAIGSLFGIG